MEQANSAEVITPQQSVKGLSTKGLAEVFYRPAAFFEQLKHQPKVLVPYIVVGLIFLLTFWLIQDLSVQVALDSPQMQQNLQGQAPPPQVVSAIRVTTLVMPTLTYLIYPLVVAALMMLVGNFFMGGKASYKQLLSVALYGAMICAVGKLVLVPLMLAKGSATASISLGVLAPTQSPFDPVWVALSSIDLFNIWEIIAVGIGLAAVYNISRNKGYLISVLSVGLLIVFGVLWTAISSAIA